MFLVFLPHFAVITKSRNSWIRKVPLEIIWSNPLLEQGQPGQIAQVVSSWVLNTSTGFSIDPTTFLGNLFQSSTTLTTEKCFLTFKLGSLYFSLCPLPCHPVAGHHWNKPGSLFFILPITYLHTWIRSPEPSLLQAGVSSLSASPCKTDAPVP